MQKVQNHKIRIFYLFLVFPFLASFTQFSYGIDLSMAYNMPSQHILGGNFVIKRVSFKEYELNELVLLAMGKYVFL